MQVYRTGNDYCCDAAKAATRTPAAHPEGYLEGFANIYSEAAAAIRANPATTVHLAEGACVRPAAARTAAYANVVEHDLRMRFLNVTADCASGYWGSPLLRTGCSLSRPPTLLP